MTMLRTILLGLLACAYFSGCSKEAQSVDPYPDMPSDLRAMQGAWEALDTNACMQCGVTIQGYTLRLRFQDNPERPLLKQNLSISRIDVARKVLVLNNGYTAWPYSVGLQDGEERFDLKFFNTVGGNWHTIQMKRAEP